MIFIKLVYLSSVISLK